MEQYKQRVDEFRRMASFADQLEDAGDDRRALAVRIALYDRVVDMADGVQREIEAKFGSEDGMMKAASADGDDAMKREAAFLSNLWKGIKGFGKGLWNAIRHGKAPAALVQGAEQAAPGSVLKRLVKPLAEGESLAQGQLTNLGRGLAIGVPAAGVLGAGAMMAGRGREPQQQVGGYPGGPVGSSGGPMILPPSGMPMVVPGGGMGPGPGGYGGGYGGGMMGGGAAAGEVQQMMSGLRDMDGRLSQLEARVQRLEAGR